MLARSPKDRSRSPHRINGTAVSQTSDKHSSNQNDTSSQIDTSSNDANTNNKIKKENDSQLRMKNLKVRK
jgi:hypothetical protein